MVAEIHKSEICDVWVPDFKNIINSVQNSLNSINNYGHSNLGVKLPSTVFRSHLNKSFLGRPILLSVIYFPAGSVH